MFYDAFNVKINSATNLNYKSARPAVFPQRDKYGVGGQSTAYISFSFMNINSDDTPYF